MPVERPRVRRCWIARGACDAGLAAWGDPASTASGRGVSACAVDTGRECGSVVRSGNARQRFRSAVSEGPERGPRSRPRRGRAPARRVRRVRVDRGAWPCGCSCSVGDWRTTALSEARRPRPVRDSRHTRFQPARPHVGTADRVTSATCRVTRMRSSRRRREPATPRGLRGPVMPAARSPVAHAGVRTRFGRAMDGAGRPGTGGGLRGRGSPRPSSRRFSCTTRSPRRSARIPAASLEGRPRIGCGASRAKPPSGAGMRG